MASSSILERGNIFFFYRPRVNQESPSSADDLQRLYVVLRVDELESKTEKVSHQVGKGETKVGQQPKQEEKEHQEAEKRPVGDTVEVGKDILLRLLVIGKKKLPDPSKRGRPFWGYVEVVTRRLEVLQRALQSADYDTQTRGTQHRPAARAVAAGSYALVKHMTRGRRRACHVHLVYQLQPLTKRQGKKHGEGEPEGPQEELHIEEQASYIIQVKNPTQPSRSFPGLGSRRSPSFPPSLLSSIGSSKFAPADPPDFLNFEGCEFLLISASDDPKEELGIDLDSNPSRSVAAKDVNVTVVGAKQGEEAEREEDEAVKQVETGAQEEAVVEAGGVMRVEGVSPVEGNKGQKFWKRELGEERGKEEPGAKKQRKTEGEGETGERERVWEGGECVGKEGGGRVLKEAALEPEAAEGTGESSERAGEQGGVPARNHQEEEGSVVKGVERGPEKAESQELWEGKRAVLEEWEHKKECMGLRKLLGLDLVGGNGAACFSVKPLFKDEWA